LVFQSVGRQITTRLFDSIPRTLSLGNLVQDAVPHLHTDGGRMTLKDSDSPERDQ